MTIGGLFPHLDEGPQGYPVYTAFYTEALKPVIPSSAQKADSP